MQNSIAGKIAAPFKLSHSCTYTLSGAVHSVVTARTTETSSAQALKGAVAWDVVIPVDKILRDQP